MPLKTVHCRACGTGITGYNFPQRMTKLRRHYKKHHPMRWKASIKRGVAKRRR